MINLARLRGLVGFLGEKGQANWWDTSFLDSMGQRFLEFIYPRTALNAGIRSTTEAAKTLHDQRIGEGRVVHLFRFSPSLEEEISQLFLHSPEQLQLQDGLTTKEEALQLLSQLAKLPTKFLAITDQGKVLLPSI